jgi:hypothetical protein
MSKCLIFLDERHGPAQLWTLPDDPEAAPRTAYVPGGPFGVAQAHVNDKGARTPWPEFADTLASGSPYFRQWDIVDVPGTMTPSQALSYVREKHAEAGLSELG